MKNDLISCIEEQLEYIDFYFCSNYFSVPYDAAGKLYCCEIGGEFYSNQLHVASKTFNMFIRHDLETNKFHDFWLCEQWSGRTSIFIIIKNKHFLLKYSERGGHNFSVKIPLNFNHSSKLIFNKNKYVKSLSGINFDGLESKIVYIFTDFLNALDQFLSFTVKGRKKKKHVLAKFFPEVPFITKAKYTIERMGSKSDEIKKHLEEPKTT